MHYSPEDGSTNGRIVIEALDPEYQGSMGQRVGLSYLDAKAINLVYCNDTCDRPLDNPCLYGYQDPNNCDVCRCPDGLGGPTCNTAGTYVGKRCGGVITVESGSSATITSPNDGDQYNDHQECNWLVEAPLGSTLTARFVEKFAVYSHYQQQCYHWVEIKYLSDFDIPGPRFCGAKRPISTLQSEHNQMVVSFRANYLAHSYFTKTGFTLQLTASNSTSVTPEEMTTLETTEKQTTVEAVSTTVETVPTTIQTTKETTTQTAQFTTEVLSTTPMPDAVCQPVDMAYLICSSHSVGSRNWNTILDMIVSTVAKAVEDQQADMRVMVITYGSKGRIEFDSTLRYKSSDRQQARFNRSIYRIPYIPESVNLAAALQTLRVEVRTFDQPINAILITDSKSARDQHRIDDESLLLSDAGVNLFAVGVGESYDYIEIMNVVGKADKAMFLNNYRELRNIETLDTLQSFICANSSEEVTPTISSLFWSCDFEENVDTLCGMRQSIDDQFDWIRNAGVTLSYGTGPSSAASGEHYLYIEASPPRKAGDAAGLILPTQQRPGHICLSFMYHMYGKEVGFLFVMTSSYLTSEETVIWHQYGTQGREWVPAAVDIELDTDNYIGIKAIRGNNYAGDIAIDQITLRSGNC